MIHIGHGGLSAGVATEVDRALDQHELIKVRLPAEREIRRALTEQIVAESGAALVAAIGRVAVFYRSSDELDGRDPVLR